MVGVGVTTEERWHREEDFDLRELQVGIQWGRALVGL